MEKPLIKKISIQFAAWGALASIILLPAGCGKKPAGPAATPSAAVSNAPESQTDMTAALAQLTQTLRKYSFEHRRVPASFSELAAAGNLGPIPAAPAGKKFAIDPKAMQVVLVNQ